MKAFSTAVLLAALAAYPLAAQEEQHEEKPAHSEVKPAPKAHPTDARPDGNAGRQQEARPAQPAKEARPQNPPAQQPHQAEQHRAPEKGAQDQQKAQQHQAQQQQKPVQQQQKDQQKTQQKDADRQRQTQQQPNAQQHRAQTEQHNHPAPAQRAQNSPAPRAGQSRRIPDDRFRSSFGHEHHFRVSRPVVVSGQPRFQYSGYWFEFVDPWPAAWSYDDDCYIDYVDDEYWLYDPVHPGMRIEINVVM